MRMNIDESSVNKNQVIFLFSIKLFFSKKYGIKRGRSSKRSARGGIKIKPVAQQISDLSKGNPI